MSGRRAIKAGFTERDTIGELDCEYLDSHDCRKEIFQLFLFMTRASPWFGNHDVNLYSPQLNPPLDGCLHHRDAFSSTSSLKTSPNYLELEASADELYTQAGMFTST